MARDTPGASTPLHQQVYAGRREAILGGRLRPGTRVPATRTLAAFIEEGKFARDGGSPGAALIGRPDRR